MKVVKWVNIQHQSAGFRLRSHADYIMSVGGKLWKSFLFVVECGLSAGECNWWWCSVVCITDINPRQRNYAIGSYSQFHMPSSSGHPSIDKRGCQAANTPTVTFRAVVGRDQRALILCRLCALQNDQVSTKARSVLMLYWRAKYFPPCSSNNCMSLMHSLFSKAYASSPSQVPCVLWNSKAYYRVGNILDISS